MTEFRAGDILWRVGHGIAEVGVFQFERYEVEHFDPLADMPLQIVDIPGSWSTRGWLLLSRRTTH